MPRRQVTSPLLIEIGARIRNIRLEQGMSLDQLAKRSGVAKGNLSSAEHGRVNITVETCLKIAAALGVSAGELLPEPEEGHGTGRGPGAGGRKGRARPGLV
ncbi:helix-turn-helix transcriptional regulator [Polyangium sp. y55x31]|uniref:helix-turn-helix domain-containing protein n=1 Tax=Polyangium sp. y55x31 TaxID=3042688 RepID=UPI00248250F7|nr:helix-turn-helix transcriptional regulator [Polyangium sp. y55x31]MDI1476424.1 helix-turn-helix transcriptional regulator [Polyangium sp. y55x31]